MIVAGGRADVERRDERAVLAERRHGDAVDVEKLVAHRRTSRHPWIAGVNGREAVAAVRAVRARTHDVRGAEVRGRDPFGAGVACEVEIDRDAARHRRDPGHLPTVEQPPPERIVHRPFRAIRQERIPRYVQDVRAVGRQDAVRALRIVGVDVVVFAAERTAVAAKGVRQEILQVLRRLAAQRELHRIVIRRPAEVVELDPVQRVEMPERGEIVADAGDGDAVHRH